MINVFFEGRLGADAELRSANNGNQFYSMRVATDEFRNGENTTVWTNVRINSDRIGKMTLKKGDHVFISGILRASTYQTKSGESAVSLDISADRINYIKSGSGSTQTTSEEVTTEEVKTKSKSKKEETVAVTAASTNNDVDDLPF